jgi:amino acid transporter
MALSVASLHQRKLRRRVGLMALMFTSVGSIIGSGWLLGAFTASQSAGPASLITWVIGAVAVFAIALVHAELGGMFPVAGGSGRFPHYAFGGLAGFSSAWFWYVGAVTTAPAEVVAALSYANSYLPGLINGTTGALTAPLGYIVAAILMVIFTAINVLGVRWLAESNRWITAWKIAIPVITVIVFLVLFHHFENLTSHGFAPSGAAPIFTALSTGVVFAYLGFEQAVQFGAESSDPKRNIPLAVIGSVVLGVIIYMGLAIAFLTGFQPGDLAKGWSNLNLPGGSFGPWAALATAAGLGWLAFVLNVDAVVSPGGTGLLYVGSTARMSFAMARMRTIPMFFADLNEQRVPLISIVVAMVIGFLVMLPFPNWKLIIGIVTSATVLAYGMQPLTLGALRRQAPDALRPYRLPLGEIVAPIAFVIANLIIYWSTWAVVWPVMLMVLAGYVILALTSIFSPESVRPKLDLKAGMWLLPYLGGLTLISFIGATDFGGRGVFPFGWDALVVAVFSVAIYVLAVVLRLPAEDAKRYMTELSAEAEAEEEELGDLGVVTPA